MDLTQSSRTATCGCGNAFTQQGIVSAGRWTLTHPMRCESCQAAAEDRLARSMGEKREDQAAQRREATAREVQSAVLALAVPPLYAGVTLDGFEMHGAAADRTCQGRVLQIGRRYLANWPEVDSVVLLRGGPGTGKGHWAWSVAQSLANQGVRIAVVKLADLIRELRASWRDREADSEATVLDHYRRLDLLVLDELSRHAFYGERIHQHLYDVLDHRIEHQRPTILTSNEDDTGLEDILRPALVSRLLGNGQVLEFGTADYRLARAA